MTKSALMCTSGSTYKGMHRDHAIYKDRGCLYVFACEQVMAPYVIKPKLMELFNSWLTRTLCFLRAKTLHGPHCLTLYNTLISSLDIIFYSIHIYLLSGSTPWKVSFSIMPSPKAFNKYLWNE